MALQTQISTSAGRFYYDSCLLQPPPFYGLHLHSSEQSITPHKLMLLNLDLPTGTRLGYSRKNTGLYRQPGSRIAAGNRIYNLVGKA